MARDRSRSRDRRRSRSRERDRDRERRLRRSRSRSRDRDRRRGKDEISRRRYSRSRSPRKRKYSIERDSKDSKIDRKPNEGEGRRSRHRKKQEPIDLNSLSGVEDDMSKAMGFAGFDSTKGKNVKGNYSGAAMLNKKRKYRQYMNRKGGFNRPLDYVV